MALKICVSEVVEVVFTSSFVGDCKVEIGGRLAKECE